MAINIQHVRIERLADRWQRWLAQEIWPAIPAELRGTRLTRTEREQLLGYGPHGA